MRAHFWLIMVADLLQNRPARHKSRQNGRPAGSFSETVAGSVVVRKFRITTPHGAISGKSQVHEVLFYNLDVIISVGYRVHSIAC